MTTTYHELIPYFDQPIVNINDIILKTKYSRRTIQRYYAMFKKSVPFDQVMKNGRPAKIKSPERAAIVQYLRHQPMSSSKDIVKKLKVQKILKFQHEPFRDISKILVTLVGCPKIYSNLLKFRSRIELSLHKNTMILIGRK